ncbi:unnamed protein product [Prunus brigantina]
MIATTGDHIWAKTQPPKFEMTPFQAPKCQWSSKHSDVDSVNKIFFANLLKLSVQGWPGSLATSPTCLHRWLASFLLPLLPSDLMIFPIYPLVADNRIYALCGRLQCRIGIGFFKDFKREFEASPFRNFLSSTSACVKLVDHIHQVMILAVLKSFLGELKGSGYHFAPKGLIFAVEAIRNSSAVALSSTQLNELETKNVDLTGKLSA